MARTRPQPVTRPVSRSRATVSAVAIGLVFVLAGGGVAGATVPAAAGLPGKAETGKAGTNRAETGKAETAGITPAALKKLPDDLRTSPRKLALVATFKAEAKRFGVPADLLMSLAYTESGWRSAVVSKHGAVGICQLLPDTARWLARDLLGQPNLQVRDPEDNIRMGARFLRQLLRTFRTERLALAAYFDGHGTVTRSGVSVAAGRYAKLVQKRRAMFQGL